MTNYWTGKNKPMHDASTEEGVTRKSTTFLCNALLHNAQNTTKTNKKKPICIMHFAAKRLYFPYIN